MALKINTNIAALTAHANMKKTDYRLGKSLEKLSTGLRINRAADDASGLSIANSLKAQSLGIGQAIKNANDGISIVQIADAALDEAINIVNIIQTKSIQAAQDGQTLETRKAIQADIDKLMAELDDIAQSTSFNGMKLLSGNFTNKKFQIGVFSGQTVTININSAESQKIGHVITGKLELTNASGGLVEMSVYSNIQNKDVDIQGVELKYNNSARNGMGALADALNKVSDSTGITAQAIVELKTDEAVKAGTTGTDFSINGVNIGAVSTLSNDSDGSLVNAINSKSDQHGVTASIDSAGKLMLVSSDGRAIEVTGSDGGVLGGAHLKTFGHIRLYQTSANQIVITDKSAGAALSSSENITIQNSFNTSIDSELAAGSVLAAGTNIITKGSSLGFNLTGDRLEGNVTTTVDSVIKAGSVLSGNSVIGKDSILGGLATVATDTTTYNQSVLLSGTILKAGTVLKEGTVITTDITTAAGTIGAGNKLYADTTLSSDVTLQEDMVLKGGSIVNSGSVLAEGSYLGADFTIAADMNVNNDMTLHTDSVIYDDTNLNISSGSTIGGDFTTSSGASITLTSDMTLKSGSTIVSGSELATSSSIGADVTTSEAITLTADMTLAAGSTIASQSTLAKDTVLTNDLRVYAHGSSGTIVTLEAGTILEKQYTVAGDQYLEYAMTAKYDSSNNSVLAAGTVLAPNNGGISGTEVVDVERFSLADIDVTSHESAQIGISIAAAALKNLNAIKAELGSIQNQLTSTIGNLTTTRVNVLAAESQIRDVDFAEESATYSKMQILIQAGTFAMAQANAVSQNVLQLLQ